ncbi:MAG TPA: hypothetical protein VEC16_01030 [Alphaproteobacteria bacterium]|nr:hypothetical protein [Alphaproteobacteria bacterium]
MMFELHVTVNSFEVDRWSKLCEKMEMKPILIFLTKGKHPVQLMCTKNFPSSAKEVNLIVEEIKREVKENGFGITRIKLEGALNEKMNDVSFEITNSVPVYTECHTKIKIPSSKRWQVLEIEKHTGLYASRSMLNSDENNEKWFLSNRKYSDLEFSKQQYVEEFRKIKKQFPDALMEMECVFIDTNPDIDSGWIEAK